jgi:hypothetical protein
VPLLVRAAVDGQLLGPVWTQDWLLLPLQPPDVQLDTVGLRSSRYVKALAAPTECTGAGAHRLVGRAAFSRLRTLVDPVRAPAAHLWAEPELIVRESSGPPPAEG